jgi:3-deoxy-manno-octulosonate cytidylyltransferase (CMP-KDO synthetase)
MGDAGFKVVIPARHNSTRLPGKVLCELAGQPMVRHVWEKARASGAGEVVIATDDRRVADAARAFGAEVCMTASQHASGTDRVEEVARTRQWDDGCVVVNLQADEPLTPAALVRQVAHALADGGADLVSACVPIHDLAEWLNPNVVKVVRDQRELALYFSRAPVPWGREQGAAALPPAGAWRHVGIYAYRAGVLHRLAREPACPLEQSEALEQLRAQWLGLCIKVVDACETPGPGVDTAADLEAVESILSGEAPL